MQLDYFEDQFRNIIEEYKMIGFSQSEIDKIVRHAFIFYREQSIIPLQAMTLDRNHIMEQLNAGLTRDQVMEYLYTRFPTHVSQIKEGDSNDVIKECE